MNTVMELTNDYIQTHILREDSIKTYTAAARACERYFGECPATDVTHRAVLAWRKKMLDQGLAKRSWNTYSSHMRTVFKYAIDQETVPVKTNPFKKTSVIPPQRAKKTVVPDAINRARSSLEAWQAEEERTLKRAKTTPAWFWLAVFETFYFTGIRLNALLCVKLSDVDLKQRMIRVRAETEKTHREFLIPVPDGLLPHLHILVQRAKLQGFASTDQLFNVNRFSSHYRKKIMDRDQVEAMYKKLITATKVRMTPHRFRHTIASDLMKQPERNIHVTKTLLNHTNIATTMEYIEPDYEVIREVMNDRSLARGLLQRMDARAEYSRRLNGAAQSNRPYRLDRSAAPLLMKIDLTPAVERSSHPVPVHSALAFQGGDAVRHKHVSLAHEQKSQATYGNDRDAAEPLSADEIAFVGKFLDWLRHRGVDSGAQLLLDSQSSLSDQLKAAKGSFEGIAWVHRPR